MVGVFEAWRRKKKNKKEAMKRKTRMGCTALANRLGMAKKSRRVNAKDVMLVANAMVAPATDRRSTVNACFNFREQLIF